MRLNTNERVRVKLTESGYRIAVNAGYQVTATMEDEQGYTTWQLWVLMSVFGPCLTIVMDVPFESNEIVVGDV